MRRNHFGFWLPSQWFPLDKIHDRSLGGGDVKNFDRISAEIAQQILSAPFIENGWDRALKSLASHTRSARGELVVFGDDHTVPFNWMTDLSEEAHREFIEMDGANPDVNVRIAAAKGQFEITHEADYDAARSRIRSDIYDEYAYRHDIVHGCQAVLAREKGSLTGLAVLRTHKDGRTTEEDREAFASLAPYVLNAVKFQQSVKHQGALMITGAFDAMERAVLVLDGTRVVRAQSQAAIALMRADSRLSVRQGRLRAGVASEDRKLQAAVHRAVYARDAGQPGGGSSVILRGEKGPLDNFIVEIHPLPRQDWALGFEPRVLVAIRSPAIPKGAQREALREMLGLTAAESDVALAVAGGLSREQIAAFRGTSLETVHTQMKSLFRKADVNREAHLAALLNQLLQ
jgi:DNA-binding CsgD family transcriptional regulator